MPEKISYKITVPMELGGSRIDQGLSKLLPQHSRTQIQDWIKTQCVTLNGKIPKPKDILMGEEIIEINAEEKEEVKWEAQNISLNILFEDESILVLNKPAGMVVHPGTGNSNSTLLNALLHHAPALQKLPRAGIVHRLDKDTSGLLVIAKTQNALLDLTRQLKERTVSRVYQAVVLGVLVSGGTVDEPMGRHPKQRQRMAIIDNGKEAITHYRVMERYRAHTRLKVQLDTGRTHQIRVHMAHVKHPLVGDPVYGGRLQLPKGATKELVHTLRTFKRQALHAFELGLLHPETHEPMSWRAPLPDDMKNLIQILRDDIQGKFLDDYE